LIFEREVPLEIRITDPRIIQMVGQEVGSRENVNFKILSRASSNSQEGDAEVADIIKIEISSDHDYFFFYRHL
jgi:hypothetical protein